ncbi:hypothetical protein HA520_14960 [Azotobacter chroococcum]|uniref:Uncharacterized protein n=1 Tax=Azotobacter chroococcum TaxID=353 RepID=A0AA44C906_9GAMM|nr:hypothetical protein [Azotobacter chroococcum]NHN78562.1 hypothetical protein [Azotobacter chroococcum]
MAQKIEVVIDGKNNAGKAIGEAGSQLNELGAVVANVASALGVALSVDAFAGWIKGSLDAAARIREFAQVSSASTAEFQRFAVGARTVGIEQEQLADIFKDVNDKVGDFLQTGGGELKDFFEGIAPQIGVTAEQFKNLSGPQALQLYVSSLEKAGLNQQEMTFYLEAMADDATKLLPLLQNSGAGMKTWADEAERMGLILSEDTIVQAAAFSEQMKVAGLVTDNLGTQIGAAMLPSLQELSGLLIDVAGDADTAKIAADIFGTALKMLATTAIGVGSTIASVGRAIGGLAAAAVAAASGELSQAGEIIRQITADNQKSADEAEERIKKLWSGEYQQAGKSAVELNKQIADSQQKTTTAGGSAAAMTAKQKTELKALNDELEKERGKIADVSKEQEAINKLKELNIDLASKEAKQAIEKARLVDSEQKASEAKKKAEQEAESAAKKRGQEQAQLYKQQESYVLGLEKQAATLGLTAAQVRAYELAEKSLAGALNERAKAALAVIEANEKQQQADQNAATNAGLQADYLRAAGQPAEAAMLEVETRFAQMRKQFAKDSNADGLALLDQLIPVEQARARLDALQAEIDQAFDRQGRGEQSIDTQVNAGLITESEGRARLLDLHRQTADAIEQYLPELERMAQLPGPLGEQAQSALDNVRNQVLELRSASSDLEIALRDGLQSGIQEALAGLADGTLSLRDAVTSLLASVADAMAQLAAQQLAEQASAGIMGLLGGGQSDSSMTAGAAAVTGSAAALSTAGGTLLTGAAAIQAAAASLAAANGMSGVAGGGGGGAGGGFLSGIGDWFGGLFGGAGFATGGHVTGPGTTTSDSIPAMLSNWEYVTRAAVVQQPGALDFLHAFNARGMAALDDYARRVRHATGGLAGVPAPALPAPGLGSTRLAEPAKAMAATVKNAVNLHVYDDPVRITQAAFNSRQGEEDFVVMLSKDPAKYRSILQL